MCILTRQTSAALSSCRKFLSVGVAMFRRVDRPRIAPLVRSAVLFLFASALLLGSLRVGRGLAAPPTVVRDPQALNLIASSLKALTGPVAVNDVTLHATAGYAASSDARTTGGLSA